MRSSTVRTSSLIMMGHAEFIKLTTDGGIRSSQYSASCLIFFTGQFIYFVNPLIGQGAGEQAGELHRHRLCAGGATLLPVKTAQGIPGLRLSLAVPVWILVNEIMCRWTPIPSTFMSCSRRHQFVCVEVCTV